MLDFVNSEFFATFFFSALRFLVTVSSDLSGCSCMLKALFSKLSRRPLILAFANPIFLFHRPIPLSKTYCATHFVTIIRVGRKDRTVPLGLAKTQSCAGHRTTHTGRRIGA